MGKTSKGHNSGPGKETRRWPFMVTRNRGKCFRSNGAFFVVVTLGIYGRRSKVPTGYPFRPDTLFERSRNRSAKITNGRTHSANIPDKRIKKTIEFNTSAMAQL